MATDNPRLDVAVFIDFENVYVSVRDKLDVNPNFEIIMDRVADLGRVVIARAYADWYRYPRVTSALYANGIEPMYVPTYYYDRDLGRTGRAIKNSVDMNLCIDAMKTLYTNPNIGKFVLATGDRDFIPLVNAIRQHGKEVIIIGVGGAASGHLAQSADEFIFYEQLLGKKPQPLQADAPRIRMPERGRDVEEVVEPAPSVRMRQEAQSAEHTPPPEPPAPETAREETDIYDMLVRAVHLARERGYVCSFGSLKLVMKELMGGEFKESKYRDSTGKPFAKFKDFALEAERRGKVQVFTSGAVVEVFLPGEDPYKLSQFAQDLKEEPPVSTSTTPVHVDAHIDGRPVSSSRRRRRRRSSTTRTTISPDTITAPSQDEFVVHEDVTDELMTEALHDVMNGESAATDVVFEELLDRLEAERERQEALASFDVPIDEPMLDELPDLEEEPDVTISGDSLVEEPILAAPEPDDQMMIMDRPVELSEPFATPETPVGEPTAHLPETPPFTDAEWQMLREVVVSAGRPLSFAQIHDLMRGARNNAGIVRTNEELRSLIKQAINTGVLRRSGKGARVVYHLAPYETSAATEGVDASAVKASEEAASEPSIIRDAVETMVVSEASAPAPALESPEIVAAEPLAAADVLPADVTDEMPQGKVPEETETAAEPEVLAPAPDAVEEGVVAHGVESPPVVAEGSVMAEETPRETSVTVGVPAEAPVTAVDDHATAESKVVDQPTPRRRRTTVRTNAEADQTTAEARPTRSRSKAAVTAPTEEAPRPTRRRKKVETTEEPTEV